jgi:hypothetical protein
MRKVVLLVLAILSLALTGVASAADPQGSLTGAADFNWLEPIQRIEIIDPIVDGETVYVGVNNDRSGDCDGDSGTVRIIYKITNSFYDSAIRCAHYTGKNSMTFSFLSDNGVWMILRVQDKGQTAELDDFHWGYTILPVGGTGDAVMLKWVNQGYSTVQGPACGCSNLNPATLNGDFQVTAT